MVLVFFWLLTAVHATVFVLKPSSGSVCHGAAPCTVEWIDDGERPLLNAISVSTVGLFTGNQQIVQRIEPVDVANSLSLTFTPDPQAGPDSDTYYIAFSSADLEVNGSHYTAFSPFFRLDGMSGSFASPLPSATSVIPIPSSLTHSSSTTLTITVGTLSTSPLSTAVQQSSTSFTFSTSTTSPSTTPSIPVSASPSSTSNSVKLRLSLPALITSFVLLLVV